MHSRRLALATVCLVVLILVAGSFTCAAKLPVDYVDPFIGTDATEMPAPWGPLGGTYPGAVAPFGMAQMTPETRALKEPRGYYYSHDRILFFSMVDHVSGYPSGSHGSIRMLPVVEESIDSSTEYSSAFSHDEEQAVPGYYMVRLADYDILVELTATERTGFARLTFPQAANRSLLWYDVDEIEAVGENRLVGRRGRFHFSAEFNVPFAMSGAYQDGLYVQFAPCDHDQILMKVGFSSVSPEKAKVNADAEIPHWDFDQVRENTRLTWNDALSRISVEGGTEEQRIRFYTALYHSLLLPHVFSDVDGEYRGDDGKLYHTNTVYYYRFSPWDTFRTEHPLLVLLYPSRQLDMVRTLIHMYEQTGQLRTGPMTGNHAVPIIVDTYMKGLTDFDLAKAYEAMRKALMEPPYGRADIADYLEHTYVPAEIPESVTKTLEYAYNDWALAQFAQVMGEEEDFAELSRRAMYYQNVFDPETRFMLPKRKDGTFASAGGYSEGDKWHYTWFVPHDLWGLGNLIGGPEANTARLVELQENYYHDNEPILHYAYLFNYSGAPWWTQEWIRSIMRDWYPITPGGVPGNDDLGSMSAWYVFSAMGFFPVCPGRPLYDLGSPVFTKVTVALENGNELIIEAPAASEENMYVQSVTINGKEQHSPWFSHEEIARGGHIFFVMGPEPNVEWGTSLESVPSVTTGVPEFELLSLTAPARANVNEPVVVSVDVANYGDAVGSCELTLYVAGEPAVSRWALVEPGAVETVEFEIRLHRVGEVEVTVNSKDPVTITVAQAALF